MAFHEKYMSRCLDLAQNGLGFTAPNPLVGCVIVVDETIIGEGYHHRFGGPHAEAIAINRVKNKELLKEATLYVNLEPCAHWGKTPPCADLIIEMGIPKIIVGCGDIFSEVNGKGIEKLKRAGLQVESKVLEKECVNINRRFFRFHQSKRPYIILKWAHTADGFTAKPDHSSKWITNPYSRLLVHQWRSEETGIMVGTNTAIYDDPQLSSRDMKTKSPVRIILDQNGKIPRSHHLFDGSQRTIIFTGISQLGTQGMEFIKMDFDSPQLLNDILTALYERDIQSVFVEGGSALLQSFINEGLWDEARVFEVPGIYFGSGRATPILGTLPEEEFDLQGDILKYFYNSGDRIYFT